MPAHVAGMMIRGLNEVGNAIKGFTVFECGASAKPSNFCEKFVSKNCPSGGVTVFGQPAATDISCTSEIPLPGLAKMDGVIVAVAHDEFRGWSFRACVGFGCGGGGG